MAQQEPGAELTAKQALDFLEKLARDDDFRARLEKDARRVFREYGIELPRGLGRDVQLPPKESLERALSSLPQGRLRRPRASDVFFCWPWILFAPPRKRR